MAPKKAVGNSYSPQAIQEQFSENAKITTKEKKATEKTRHERQQKFIATRNAGAIWRQSAPKFKRSKETEEA